MALFAFFSKANRAFNRIIFRSTNREPKKIEFFLAPGGGMKLSCDIRRTKTGSNGIPLYFYSTRKDQRERRD